MKKYKIIKNIDETFSIKKRFLFIFWCYIGYYWDDEFVPNEFNTIKESIDYINYIDENVDIYNNINNKIKLN